MFQVAPNAVHYVLGLWSRLVAAVPYVRVDTKADPMLDAYVPKVSHQMLLDRQDVFPVMISFFILYAASCFPDTDSLDADDLADCGSVRKGPARVC